MHAVSGNKDGVTVFLNGRTYTVSSSAPNYQLVLDAVSKDVVDEQELQNILNFKDFVSQKIKDMSNGCLCIESDGIIYLNGRPVHSRLSDMILESIECGTKLEVLAKFIQNLLSNEDVQTAERITGNGSTDVFIAQVLKFLSQRNHPLTSDGCFLAYKGVLNDYYSSTSGSIKLIEGKSKDGRVYNAPGEKIRCERKDVDPTQNLECSYGLHVGTLNYATSFSQRTVIVKVNPKDIVGITPDSSHWKMRVCAYEVLDDYDKPLEETPRDEKGKVLPVKQPRVQQKKPWDKRVRVGSEIAFNYVKDKLSSPQRRFAKITELVKDDDGKLKQVYATLLPPEKCADATRCFKVSRMSNVEWL